MEWLVHVLIISLCGKKLDMKLNAMSRDEYHQKNHIAIFDNCIAIHIAIFSASSG